jgi:hypothetical protein
MESGDDDSDDYNDDDIGIDNDSNNLPVLRKVK